MNYYNQSRLVTEATLCGMLGGMPSDDILHSIGWYPVRYDYFEFDPDEYRQVPEGDLAFNAATQEYVQGFRLVELTAEEKAQREKARQREAKEKRRQEILAELDRLDSRSERCVRAVSKALAHGQTPNPDDLEMVDGYEAQAEELREELRTL